MKKIYLISYDINTAVKNYDALYKQIKRLAGDGEYKHPLESVWLIYSSLSATQIAESLRDEMDPKDRILVIEIGEDRQGWLAKSVWSWIRERMN